MTTIFEFDPRSIFEVVKDARALEVVQRVIQAEATFHESRLGQLREMDKAIGERVAELRRQG